MLFFFVFFLFSSVAISVIFMYATSSRRGFDALSTNPLMPSLHLITLNYDAIKELKRIANEQIWRRGKIQKEIVDSGQLTPHMIQTTSPPFPFFIWRENVSSP